MNLRFFRLSKPSKFNYKPLYYNPEQEELEQRIRNAQGNSQYTKTAEGKLERSPLNFNRSRMADAKGSNKRLILIFTGLIILSYWLLKGFWNEIINLVL